jgi:hypothetical protein
MKVIIDRVNEPVPVKQLTIKVGENTYNITECEGNGLTIGKTGEANDAISITPVGNNRIRIF